jgi:hypothetical protein
MKGRFTPADDILLAEAVIHVGTLDWSVIAKELPGRTARQCRERWQNYLSPQLIHGPWTESEDERLLQEYKEIGPKWHHMKLSFPGRSRNSIKNRFIALQRREREKGGKSVGDLENPITTPIASPPANNQAVPNRDPMSFLDLVEDDGLMQWITEPKSDSNSYF